MIDRAPIATTRMSYGSAPVCLLLSMTVTVCALTSMSVALA